MSDTTAPAPAVPAFDDAKRLADAMKLSGEDLLAIQEDPIDAMLQERHQLYIWLVMSLVKLFWNGNRRGPSGTYYFRKNQQNKTTSLYGDQNKPYLGHNIAAIAVEAGGKVIDFDFNHNDVFRSSVQHAEARLVQRLFSLTGLRSKWEPGAAPTSKVEVPTFEKMFANVSIYTTLEPCAQCTGIMALAGIKEIVYVQPDDGTMRVSQVLYRLKPYGKAPKPIIGRLCGGPDYGKLLSDAYEVFKKQVFSGTPVWVDAADPTNKDTTPSLTSFLCTDAALDIFGQATSALPPPHYETYTRSLEPAQEPITTGMFTNQEVRDEVASFLSYASRLGHRGTAH